MAVSTDKGGTMEFTTGADTFRHFQVMSNELSTPKILVCPADTRVAATNFVRLKNQNVSYFVGLEANDANPQRFLDGDRNITGDSEPENGILKLVPGQRVELDAGHARQSGQPRPVRRQRAAIFQFRPARGPEKFRRPDQHLADCAAGIKCWELRYRPYFYFEFRRFLRHHARFNFGCRALTRTRLRILT